MEKSSSAGLLSIRSERRLAVVLFALTCARALSEGDVVKPLRLAEMKDSENGKRRPQRLPSASKPQDHPLVSWIVHNATVVGLLWAKSQFVSDLKSSDSNLKMFAKLMTGSVFLVDGCLALCHIYATRLYAHVPWFSTKKKYQTWSEIFKDYMSCNFVVNVVTSLLQISLFRSNQIFQKGEQAVGKNARNFRPLEFLFKLAWMRIFTDAVFWLGHWVLHTKPFYWAHKKHHEHNNTKLTTNYHFAWYDLMIEGFLPFFAGLASYETLIGRVTESEANALSLYIFMHDILSHTGKPTPLMSVLPPLSPWLQRWDDRNTWAHEVHHRVLKANYSISWWFDYVLGTSRWSLTPQQQDQEE